MMSPIGSKGFTLIEVMIATAILSFGLVLIYQAFFISLDTFNYYLNHLNAQLWLDEKIWQVQDDFRRYKVFSPTKIGDEFIMGSKDFNWQMGYSSIKPEELYKVGLTVSWKQGSRRINLLREAYVSYFPEE